MSREVPVGNCGAELSAELSADVSALSLSVSEEVSACAAELSAELSASEMAVLSLSEPEQEVSKSKEDKITANNFFIIFPFAKVLFRFVLI